MTNFINIGFGIICPKNEPQFYKYLLKYKYNNLVIHSDRGSQYISNAWREATEKMQQSYSHSGYP